MMKYRSKKREGKVEFVVTAGGFSNLLVELDKGADNEGNAVKRAQ